MEKLINYELKRVQITCPNCKYEFPYDKNALDKKIALLGKRMQELNHKLKIINRLPEDKVNKEEYNRIKYQFLANEDLIADYKLVRATLKQEEDRLVFNNLKIALRELGGDDLYKRCMDQALRESTAYTTENSMGIGYYTRAGGKHINKV